jgi:uncharacterized protein YrrD
MLQRAIRQLKGDTLVARDGVVGAVDDVYFDDERWAVRYLVVDSGSWLPGRKVLISPASVVPQHRADEIHVDLTREEIEDAPGIDEDPPISRSLEQAHARYYSYPYYWVGPYLWGPAAVPLAAVPDETAVLQQARLCAAEDARTAAAERARESHLRSSKEVAGYKIQAVDGSIGHVEDFLIDFGNWAITDLLVDTRNWLPGKKVLVPPTAISDIDWANRAVSVRLTRAELETAPEAS